MIGPTPIPARDRPAAVGLFEGLFFLDTRFSVGRWQLVVRDSVGGTPSARTLCFDLVVGGDPDGAVVAVADFVLPAAHYLVQELDGGILAKGKNPYLP